ncbi:MAG: EI24 domain-containing protein [Crocinitomicaceae bacterium]|jgi:CysZ protein|nr:EI24 domain-containing protein [Crocinitomicaceae bacterium]MDA9881439.1 EI24 domain-containing protein [Crocinitomicaceae bacterium]MDG1037281.1 EI24 domain-containing protein [Crocinitomicaceae bacterium]MDG1741234.1 EI24 domain-containing protein [Crocinitomicaceae bacterium]
MRFFKNLLFGFKSYIKAVRLIVEQKWYWYLTIPAVLMLIIYKLGEMVQQHYVVNRAENMNEIVWYIIHVTIEILIAVLLMKFAKYLVVIILSPLLSSLSMKTERVLTGKTYPFNLKQLIQDIKRAMKIVVRNIMWETLFVIIIFTVAYLGWEDPASSPIFYLTYAIGFYYYGFGFLDYINERRRLDMDESITFVRDHRGLTIAIGSIYSLMLLVPVDLGALFDWSNFGNDALGTISNFMLNLLLWISASAAPIFAIIAATIAMHDIVDLSTNEYSKKINNLEEEIR